VNELINKEMINQELLPIEEEIRTIRKSLIESIRTPEIKVETTIESHKEVE
jgi:hypothetical protein